MGIRAVMNATLEAWASALELSAVENRTDITRIEALAAEEFQTKMMEACDDEDGRASARDVAIALTQLGITRFDDVADMARAYNVMRMFDLTISDVRALGHIKKGARP